MFEIEKCKPDVLNRFWSHVEERGKCWEWTASKQKDGYGQFSPYSRHMMAAHRFINIYLNGPLEPGEYVLHTCDNRACVRPTHLFRGTHLDNMQDMVRKGRSPQGERHGRAKLNAEQVREIRQRAKEGAAYQELSQEFSVSREYIGDIVRRRRWASI